MSDAFTLYRHLKAWRDHLGLSQEQVGNILGHDKSTIHRWETGKRAMDLQDLERLAKIYGVSPVALLLAPGDIGLAEKLSKAKEILESASGKAGEAWISMGEELKNR